ncbi:ABC transporter substrate-binding protein [Parablautia intestinalis]|uniref:ABC transporter substrate-binding protein n=1 Tax=Parablautia intestinalis TaxID=2320100 RepID=UPI00256EB106|nr:ABC transporter substrate-binding protein [Parablautia intestinalis]
MRTRLKKLIALFGAVTLTASLLLTGCGSSKDKDSASAGGASNSSVVNNDTAGNEDGAQGNSSVNMEDLPVIKMATMTGANYDDSDAVEAEINKILAQKVGATLDITWSGMGTYSQQVNLMLTGDGEVDIVMLSGVPLATYAGNGMLLDLSDYYAQDPDPFLEWLDVSYIDSCRVNGQLYAIPEVINFSNEILVHANKAMVDDMGIEIDDSKIWTMDEIHDLVKKAMETYPDIYGIVPQTGSQFLAQINYDNLGDTSFVGVIEDHGNTGKVISVTECEEYIEFSKTMRKWYQEGLIMQDCMSNTESWSSMIPAGKAFCAFDAGAYPDNGSTDDTTYYNLTIYPNWSAANCAVRLDYGIAANSKNPDLAFAVLKELYTNADICNLLMYGIEGTHYQVTDGGKAAPVEGVSLENSGYSCGFINGWVLPNMLNAYPSYTSADEFSELLRNYDANAIKSGALGCVFDSTNVTNEYTACVNVFEKYYFAIMSGSMDTESTLETFRAELKAAGEDVVIAEKQAQLDAFLANK